MILGYYIWNVFNPLYLSPVYVISFILIDRYYLKETRLIAAEIAIANLLCIYANIVIVFLLELTVGSAIGMTNILTNYQGTRIVNIVYLLCMTAKFMYYSKRSGKEQRHSLTTAAMITIAITLVIFLIECFVLTGYVPV